MPILKGSRPRPRVGLVGNFEEKVSHDLKTLFPTIWTGESFFHLVSLANPNEIDLIIIAPNTPDQIGAQGFLANAHVISFSDTFTQLPGPVIESNIAITKKSSTEEFCIPEQSLGFYNLLENNIATENAKGWPIIDIRILVRHSQSLSDEAQKQFLLKSALLYDPHSLLPFATKFIGLDSHLGVACLPCHFFDIVPWVEIICQEWAIVDKERFPNFGDWTKDLEWMTQEEESLKLEIEKITDELGRITIDYNKRITELSIHLLETSLLVNKGKRRLITAQGGELLLETVRAFEELGYQVKVMDNEIDEGTPKKEDLRIQDPDEKDWEAIVEVRGHAKSSGQTSDLSRLLKFARLYQTETGHPPNKLIYIINGQIELPSPRQRQEPFSSAPDDVAAFGEQDGMIIWTVNLFKILKSLHIKRNIVTAQAAETKEGK
jgi:hypothetical protein